MDTNAVLSALLTTGGMVPELELVPNPTLKPNPMRSDERSSGLGSGSAAPAWNRRLVIAQDGVAESGALFTRMGWRGETKGRRFRYFVCVPCLDST